MCLGCWGRRKEKCLSYRCVKEGKDVVEGDVGDCGDLQTHWRCYAVSRLGF